ncbi:MAG: hypothetical protein ACFFCH_08020 [Promethearchaeota archaeon]
MTELPSVPTTAISLEAKSRSISSYIAFGLIFFAALIATTNIIYSIYLQLFVFLPSIPTWMGFQIYNYLILDALLVIGVLLMYGGAVIIYFEKSWPYGGIIALFGAFMSLTLLALFLGALGAFINLCSRPEPK